MTAWGREPTILGSYSHAVPGAADARAVLAAPVSPRLAFAGEACSPHDFSTAHGAWQSGLAAADWIAAGGRRHELLREPAAAPRRGDPAAAGDAPPGDPLSHDARRGRRRPGADPGGAADRLDPETALALFIAPALVDAAFDFPAVAARSLWRPLFALAVLAVVLSAAAVAGLGVALAGLPLYAALALGAIVAPPDAAAATAVLSGVDAAAGVVAVLKGESLLNDASALLIFAAATAFHHHEGATAAFALRLAIAVPGRRPPRHRAGAALPPLHRPASSPARSAATCSSSSAASRAWIIAERLELSAVLCLVAFAMTIARDAGLTTRRPLAHPQLRGLGHRGFPAERARLPADGPAGARDRRRHVARAPARGRGLRARRDRHASSWCGWPGCSATAGWPGAAAPDGAEAPPTRAPVGPDRLVRHARAGDARHRLRAARPTFPQRDLIVLTAFAVVLATLVVQGLTLAPLVRLLGLAGDDGGVAAELDRRGPSWPRRRSRALDGPVRHRGRPLALFLRRRPHRLDARPEIRTAMHDKRAIGLAALRRQRERLEELRAPRSIGPDAFLVLQEELDFLEVTLSDEDDRRIEQS